MADSNTSAGPLLQDDVNAIQRIIVFEAMDGISLGIFILLVIMAMYTLVGKGLGASMGRRFLTAAIIILVLSSTTLFSSSLVADIESITFTGPNPVPSSMLMDLGFLITTCSRVNYFISDLIVVWRAWVLSNRRIFRIILAMCILTTFSCMISELFLTIRTMMNSVSSPNKDPLLDLLMIVPLIATNIVATSIVAYQTWIYRTQIKVHLGHSSGRNRVERILILVVESGVIYCGIWILTVISTFTDSSGTFVNVMGYLVSFLSAIYPLAIILLVEHGKTDDMISAGGTGVSQPIQFASVQSNHSHSIVQSIADHIQSRRHDEESGNVNEDVELQLDRVKEESNQ